MEKKTFISNNPTGSQPVVTDFTIESNKAQYILLGDTTLEKVDTPDYTGDGNCVVYKHNDNEDKDEKIVVWSQAEYDFLEKQYDKNYTVHPSLWNNGRNNHLNGVFRVHDEMPIFQVRGYDMANISFVYTGKSWLIFDIMQPCNDRYSETPEKEYDKIGYDKTFYKYQYCETLYECYKYLAGNYVPDSRTQFVKFCIDLAEPYVNRFRRKPGERPDGTAPKGEGKGAEYYPFDKDDLNTWKKYCLEVFGKANRDDNIWQIYNENIRFCGNGDTSNENLGIGQDGEFYGSELLHFLYLCYRFLYVINNKQNQ